jgi:peptidoglycan/xylan/chitin deacetylase (PgdA/CDA1 family)
MCASAAAVIGAHTHSHPALSTLNYQRQLHEINTSKEILEKIIRKKIVHFSYPYGTKKDYNSDSINACREAGFDIVSANFYNQMHSWTDAFQLPRILVRNWEPALFREKLSKFFRY